MSALRFVLLLLGGLAVLAVAVVAIAVTVVDLNAYRNEIAAEVEAATGRSLAIDGDIALDAWSFTPEVVMNDVGFGNAQWGTRAEMIRFRRLELALDLVPLISGDISVRRLALIEPRLLLETDTSGRGNWIFAEAADGGSGGTAAPGRLPVVSEIVIEDASVTYRDGRTGEVMSGTLGDATLRTEGPRAPMRLEAAGTLGDAEVRIAADLDPLARLLQGESYGARLDLGMGDSDLAGDMAVALRAVPPHITADLSSKRLNLDRLTGGTGPSGGPGTRLFDDAPLGLGVLRSFDLALDYDTDELVLGGRTFTAVAGQVRLRGGELAVSDLSGDLTGARVEGSLAVDANADPAVVGVDATVKGADLADLAGGLAAGPLDVALTGQGAGRSLAEIMGTLTGRLRADVGNGRVDDTVFDFLSADLLSAIQPWAPAERGIVLNCGVADFAMREGVGTNRVLLVDTNRAYIVGRRGGTVSLRAERVDLLLDPFTKKTSVATLVAAPLRVSGPLADPSVRPDPGQAIKDVAMMPFDVVGSVVGGAVGAVEQIVTGEGGGGGPDVCGEARAAVRQQAEWPAGGGSGRSKGGVGGAIEGGIKGIGEGIKGIFE